MYFKFLAVGKMYLLPAAGSSRKGGGGGGMRSFNEMYCMYFLYSVFAIMWLLLASKGSVCYGFSKNLLHVYDRSLYAQLTHDAPIEKFSESRVHLLKSQVFQLERQVSYILIVSVVFA